MGVMPVSMVLFFVQLLIFGGSTGEAASAQAGSWIRGADAPEAPWLLDTMVDHYMATKLDPGILVQVLCPALRLPLPPLPPLYGCHMHCCTTRALLMIQP